MKKIIEFLKKSNHYKPLIGGFIVGLLACSPVTVSTTIHKQQVRNLNRNCGLAVFMSAYLFFPIPLLSLHLQCHRAICECN